MGKKKTKSKAVKSAPAVSEDAFKNEMDLITAAICSVNQTVFLKVCRLCESKDGPFLNIFDADKVTAKKIEELMPFKIAENDDLPHKICFRCSAKVEELYEFIQKCINTQKKFHNALGKTDSGATKTKTRAIWEEKLNKNNISNDDICDALIKKAMEGIKDIPLNPIPREEKSVSPALKKDTKSKFDSTQVGKGKESKTDAESKSESDIDNDKDMSLKQLKLSLAKCDKKLIPTRTSRSQNVEGLLDGLPDYKRNTRLNKSNFDSKQNMQEDKKRVSKSSSEEEGSSDSEIQTSLKEEKEKKDKSKPVEGPPKPFDIMDHVSIIKVNGVGVLFQCKLCNRNFLKKEVVMNHGCAKTGGVPKLDFTKNIIPPEPPRATVVKYINTKIDGELGKPLENKTASAKSDEDGKKIILGNKPKPKIGPASRVKRDDDNPMIGMTVAPIEEPPNKPDTPPPVTTPSVQFPSIPSLNSRYKLVPGPNNTFQLVEEKNRTDSISAEEGASKTSKKRKSDEQAKPVESKTRKSTRSENSSATLRNKSSISEVIDLEDSPPQVANSGPEKSEKKSHDQPYPVGLFSTLPHHSSIYPPPVVPEPTFTTPAMKKQSYTIVQTGNPSKLLISTKPQVPVEEPTKKRQKRSKHESKDDADTDDKQLQPFNVTLEDTAPPPKDSFFTFINVDPLLQPSYVLPTDNIIQESQISTSTPASKGNADSKEKDKYSCNMCDETFSREKKLLAHIHSHYNKMDEEDMLREKSNRKRNKKY